jgi:hypothetical protein
MDEIERTRIGLVARGVEEILKIKEVGNSKMHHVYADGLEILETVEVPVELLNLVQKVIHQYEIVGKSENTEDKEKYANKKLVDFLRWFTTHDKPNISKEELEIWFSEYQ